MFEESLQLIFYQLILPRYPLFCCFFPKFWKTERKRKRVQLLIFLLLSKTRPNLTCLSRPLSPFFHRLIHLVLGVTINFRKNGFWRNKLSLHLKSWKAHSDIFFVWNEYFSFQTTFGSLFLIDAFFAAWWSLHSIFKLETDKSKLENNFFYKFKFHR